jgi:hypothetical protein
VIIQAVSKTSYSCMLFKARSCSSSINRVNYSMRGHTVVARPTRALKKCPICREMVVLAQRTAALFIILLGRYLQFHLHEMVDI